VAIGWEKGRRGRVNIHGNLNLPITKESVVDEVRRIQGLVLEAKHGRETDLSPSEIEMMLSDTWIMLNRLEAKAPRVIGHKG
jgi:hypothetical protein